MYNSYPNFSGSLNPPYSIARSSNERQQASFRQPSGKIFAKIYEKGTEMPIKGVKVSIYKMTEEGRILSSRQSDIITLYTNEFGETDVVALPTPTVEDTIDPLGAKPYAEYAVSMEAVGYAPVILRGTQIFPEITAVQKMELIPVSGAEGRDVVEIIDIPEHTLIGQYPQQDSQQEQQQELQTTLETRQGRDIDVIIPEFVIVHDGHPNTPAPRYKLRFKDYIKNVLASEVYPFWKKDALIANALCVISYTLNRVYTNHYKDKGFTITGITQFDHKYSHGRNTFEETDTVVDEVFKQYIAKPGENAPLFAQYRQGKKKPCPYASRPGMLYQFGTACLAERGMNYMEILNYYYKNVEVRLADFIQVIKSFPGYNLKEGDQKAAVRTIQKYLFQIRKKYTNIPEIIINGTFDSNTVNAVKAFQRNFQIPENGVVDEVTWNKLNDMYVNVTNLPGFYPILQNGSQGESVKMVQSLLKKYGFYAGEIDGFFGLGTERSVKEFQKIKSFTVTGIVRKELWRILEELQFTAGTQRTTIDNGINNTLKEQKNLNLNIKSHNPSNNTNSLFVYPPSTSIMTNSPTNKQSQSFYKENGYYPFY
ncbi:peptidoglycan-binding domain-containing protein [Bacillus cereus]|uniref:Peptidoglycan-binding protein n=1 Tax=Bacillus cereus TaxID=1396 RepID=A0A2B9E2D8_BACCE|nr:peptidoglycan-binding protein [Bacillus cereus]PGM94043.1 peptidoglycan-binding protein [Bacillus cereus]